MYLKIIVINLLLYGCVVLELSNSRKFKAVRDRLNRIRKRGSGLLKLVGGKHDCEGNVEILYNDTWCSIRDDMWSSEDAAVVCQQIGCSASESMATKRNYFGVPKRKIWLESVNCLGTEQNILKCKLGNLERYDDGSSGAGVICHGDGYFKKNNHEVNQKWKRIPKDIQVRIQGGRTLNEGRVELKRDTGQWEVICGNDWSNKEALVICKTLNLGYAKDAIRTLYFGGNLASSSWSSIRCLGNESSLDKCFYNLAATEVSKCHDIAGVICGEDVPDLIIDHNEISRTAHLEDKQMFFLQCAMEENCVASSAYEVQRENPDWHFETRRLLRFTAKIFNAGSADFRPALPKHLWEWHMCHMHYHSMEVFAKFDILDRLGEKVAEGHKASFCLEDNQCLPGIVPRYACANYGDQGISVNCSDIYKYSVDCQWIDVTDLEPGHYILKVIVNPAFKVAEMKYDNNAAVCDFTYGETYGMVTNCVVQHV
ncbi:lysyl oxidase homolog 3 [Cylas formicarius]|uniref:lysyl oxidase homolog 3 n=1 Tax=Cylas formicarius TaxID=197179 RepID=UPI002958D3E0|nr:lysyl oxidase homolog 3 [Cylas formicarius]